VNRGVILGELPAATEVLWGYIVELTRRLDPTAWVLVGGQMVMLHAHSQEFVEPVRASQDVDILADLIVSTENYTTCSRVVVDELKHRLEPDSQGLRYRHRNPESGTVIDILCPDHRAPTGTVGTLSVEGGFQALERRTLIDVRLGEGDQPVGVPVPDLLGASVLKAAAAVVDSREPERHVHDLALLVSLMEDPLEERSRFKGNDRSRLLRVHPQLQNENALPWRRLGTRAEEGYLNWNILVAVPR
jgi:hypothetical protein